jgi:hypothetical protein
VGAFFEVPTGALDGVNETFVVAHPYAPGSTAVFLNGLLLHGGSSPEWLESDPVHGVVTLVEAPHSGDVIQIYYYAFLPQDPLPVCRPDLRALLGDLSTPSAQLESRGSLGAVVVPVVGPLGGVRPVKDLGGVVVGVPSLSARVEVCSYDV